SRLRRAVPFRHQAGRAPSHAGTPAGGARARTAAGGHRRHHRRECPAGDRRGRGPGRRDRRRVRCIGSGRRRARHPRPVPLNVPSRGHPMDTRRSHALFERAQALMPGGVNSPVRAFRSVGGEPLFAQRAEGPCVFDVDGNRYLDYVGSWGPMIAGHNHPAVLDAVQRAARDGLSFGVPNALEVDMAEAITRLVPSMEMVRMVNSGTEATLSAIRLARGATGRARIVKFEGCYHGHGDSFLVKAGSGALTFGVPTSPGVPKALADLTLTLPYNDFNAATALFDDCGADIAGLII